MDLDVVIPCYNALPYLMECLRTLDGTYPDRNLILVDDCSEEETRVFITKYLLSHPNTDVIWRSRRGWFTRAVNTGIKFALCEGRLKIPWLICLNSDCEVGTGAFEEMEAVWNIAEKELGKPVAEVGCEGPCPTSHIRWTSRNEPDGGVTGHCILFKKEVMKEHGFRFPQSPLEVPPGNNLGLTAQSLVHFNSDGLLTFWMNRKGFATLISYHSAVTHHGNKSGFDGVYSQNVDLLGD